jgi:TIR domain
LASEPQTAFFSYSRDDTEFALRLAEDLKAAGANVWLDQLDIAPGQRWARAVQDALNNCQRLLVILSPSSVSSTNVEDEVAFALEEHKAVIPVFYRDCKVPFQLRPFHYADFRTNYDHGLKTLLRTLGGEQQAAAAGAAASAVPKDTAAELLDVAERIRAAEQQPLEQEEEQAAEQARLEQRERERLATEEREQQQKLEEERQAAAERARLEEERRLAAEKAQLEEQERQRKAAEEKAQQQKLDEERQAAAEQARLQEERRLAAEKAQLEEQARQRKAAEEKAQQQKLDEERQAAAEQARLQEERRLAAESATGGAGTPAPSG